MVRIIVSGFLIFCLPFISFAQSQEQAQVQTQGLKWKYGMRVGVNFDEVKATERGISIHTGSNIGGHVGVVMDINLTSHLYIQPGIMLTTKGLKIEDGRLWLGYMEVPVLFSLALPVNNEARVRLNAGPAVALGVVSINNQNSSSTNLFSEDGGLKRFNAGLIIGGGVELVGGLYLGLSYEFGLYSISPEGDVKTNSLSLTFGHSF